jgi:hypothetical protein
VRGLPIDFVISAWAIPTLVIGQFALLAILPATMLVVGTLRSPHRRELRWYTSALAASYATPLVIWAVRPGRAQSLSKDMHPALAALIIGISLLLLAKIYRAKRMEK